MPNLSDKGIYLPPSPIRKLVPFAEAAKRRESRYTTSTSANPTSGPLRSPSTP